MRSGWTPSTGPSPASLGGGGSVTTISTGTAIPVNTVTSDGTNLIFSGDAAATAGIATLTPPSTSQSTLVTEPTAPTEATGVALTPGG